MLPQKLDEITFEDIQSLIDNKVAESRTLDYKQALPEFSKDKKKIDFLGDITSLANTSGGDIIYGVAEAQDDEGKNTGIPGQIVGIGNDNQDELERRILNMFSSTIDPPIQNIELRFIPCSNDKTVLLIRIPHSYRRPHMVTYSGSSRFYGRTGSISQPWGYTEIKDAFLNVEIITERIKNFRLDRIAQIIAGKHPVNLVGDHKLVVHVIPYTSLESGNTRQVDLTSFEGFFPSRWKNMDWRYNFDGIVNCPGSKYDGATGYCQTFRKGMIETVTTLSTGEENGRPYIAKGQVEEEAVRIVKNCQKKLLEQGIEESFVVYLSVLNVAGLRIYSRHDHWDSKDSFSDPNLLFPEVIIDSTEKHIEKILQPIFDAYWQASGYPRCSLYDDEGNLTTNR